MIGAQPRVVKRNIDKHWDFESAQDYATLAAQFQAS